MGGLKQSRNISALRVKTLVKYIAFFAANEPGQEGFGYFDWAWQK